MVFSSAIPLFRRSWRPAVVLCVAAFCLTGCGFDPASSLTKAAYAAPPPAEYPVSPKPPGLSSPRKLDATTRLATVQAAGRLLDQATFGPTAADIQNVQAIGLTAYVDQQLNTPATILDPVLDKPMLDGRRHYLEGQFYANALSGPDQLRQRVAFALSQIFVVSSHVVEPMEVGYYRNLLATDAFGNFRQLMKDVTLSPAMGDMLNMNNSAAPQPGEIANENYARELMQLFSIGLYQLNQDGSPQLDGSGNPIPTYTPDQVQAFARAYTGWTYAQSDGTASPTFPNTMINYDAPMAAVEFAHDTGEKDLLNGFVLSAGQTAEQDLDGALDNIFQHPNVGPFVCKQLIQQLVMSNPSPAYVSRIAAVFADDGTGVRGNLSAVVRSILLDHKARANDTNPDQSDGHLRDPIRFVTGFYRGVGASGTIERAYMYGAELNEPVYGASSVFSFFPPDYVIPGTAIVAPEFGIENTAIVTTRLNVADQMISNTVLNVGATYPSLITVDLSASSPLGQLASQSPGALLDSLNVTFMHGTMPNNMYQVILNAIAPLTDPAQAVRVAVFLVITSPQYLDSH